MSRTNTEEVLLRLRTHPKVLFQPFIVQIALAVAHIAVYLYFPEKTGIELVDEWGQLAVHVIIGLIELVYVVAPALRWWNAQFIVTTRRLEERWGVLYRSAREIPLDRIASVTVERGILDRIFGCGTIVFLDSAMTDTSNTRGAGLARRSGEGDAGIRFHDVPKVMAVRAAIDDIRFNRK